MAWTIITRDGQEIVCQLVAQPGARGFDGVRICPRIMPVVSQSVFGGGWTVGLTVGVVQPTISPIAVKTLSSYSIVPNLASIVYPA